MHAFKLLPAAAALTASMSCSADTATAPAQPSTESSSFETKLIPMKETYKARGTAVVSTACGGRLLVSLAGGGQATHVGRYTITNSHCLDFATGIFNGGTFTKTAANGDLLRGEYTGTSRPLPAGSNPCVLRFNLNTSLRYTGGTGRFTNASGEATLIAVQETNGCRPGFPTSVQGSIEGRISQIGGQ
jgi:hypothetical protein